MRLLDSHLHLWDPAALRYDWLEGALEGPFTDRELGRASVEGVTESAAIFVQAEPVDSQQADEVRWVDTIADAAGVVGVVAGARLDRGPGTLAHLDALVASPRVVGVRHLLQGEPDGFARGAAFTAGARAVAERGLAFDACVRAHQLPDVAALAAGVPELRLVLDHLGKPAIGTAGVPLLPSGTWRRDLDAVARHDRVFCKLSGLPAEAGGRWDEEQVAPFLDAALDAFGPDRIMWGSDWPVSAVDASAPAASGYAADARRRWFAAVAAWGRDRGLAEDALFWSNAATFYGLD